MLIEVRLLSALKKLCTVFGTGLLVFFCFHVNTVELLAQEAEEVETENESDQVEELPADESSTLSEADLKLEREKTFEEIPDVREKAQTLIRDFVDRTNTDQLDLAEIEAMRAEREEYVEEQTEKLVESEGSTEAAESTLPDVPEASIDETLAEIPEVKGRVQSLIADFEGRNGVSNEEKPEPTEEPEDSAENPD